MCNRSPFDFNVMRSFTTALSLLLVLSAQGQWTTDVAANTLAGTASSSVFRALSASDGSTYIVYWRQAPAPTNMELRLQRLDADGVPLFGPDGMVVSEDINMSTSTALAAAEIDETDNIYIGVTATSGELGHVFKLDTNGDHLWSPGGVTFPGGYGIVIAPLPTGEALVSWLNVPHALMQKYDPSGGPVWPAPVPLVSGSSKTAPEAMFAMADGGITVIFHTYNFGISSTLWAQGFDGNGDVVWADPVQLSNKTTVWNTTYSVCQSGDVAFIGYKAATGLRFDSFLQRIEPDGNLPWGINGVDFDTNETDYEMDTRIALAEEVGAVYALCNYKDPSQSENGERIQRYDLITGARQFTENGKVIFPIGSDNVHASDLHMAAGQPLFLLKSGFDNGASSTTLHAVLLDADGDFAWAEETQPLATYESSKSRTHMTAPVDGQSVAVWQETRDAGPEVYAQNLTDPALTAVVEVATVGQVKVYPNPARESVFFDCHLAAPEVVELEVVDLHGRVVATRIIWCGSAPVRHRFSVAGWAPGVYAYRLCGASAVLAQGQFMVD